jgi:hypothetical protein
MASNKFDAVYDEVRALSLSNFLDSELSVKGKPMSGVIRYSECPWCGEGPAGSVRLAVLEGDRKCHCHRCKEEGDIITVAMQLWGTKNWETALRLTGKSKDTSNNVAAIKHRVIVPDEDIKKRDAERAIHLREALIKIHAATESYKDEQACMDYLHIERSLPENVIREAQRRKMLSFLPADPGKAKQLIMDSVGESLLKSSGLWKEGAKSSAIFYRPLMFILPGFNSAEFRIIGQPENDETPKSIRYGKNIKLPFVWRVEDSSRAMVVEGFIDMLSAVALGYTGHVVGMPGANSWNPEWFTSIAEKLGVKKWFLALDNDSDEVDELVDGKIVGQLKNPGQTWAAKLQEELTKLNMDNQLKSPPAHHDINDVLREKLAA